MNELTQEENKLMKEIITAEEDRLISQIKEFGVDDYQTNDLKKRLRKVGNILDKITYSY